LIQSFSFDEAKAWGFFQRIALCDPSQEGIFLERPQVQSLIPFPSSICCLYFSMREMRLAGCLAAVKNKL
jgi:hypothetical protein